MVKRWESMLFLTCKHLNVTCYQFIMRSKLSLGLRFVPTLVIVIHIEHIQIYGMHACVNVENVAQNARKCISNEWGRGVCGKSSLRVNICILNVHLPCQLKIPDLRASTILAGASGNSNANKKGISISSPISHELQKEIRWIDAQLHTITISSVAAIDQTNMPESRTPLKIYEIFFSLSHINSDILRFFFFLFSMSGFSSWG